MVPDHIVLSYSESNTFGLGCPRFRVDFSSGGHVNYECLGSCAVPGQQHHIVPAERFRELVQAFHDAEFFGIPRTDRNRIVEDATVIRLTYRDERRIHEVVDASRQIPKINDLENRMKAATGVGRYLQPFVALYRRLVDSGWDVNTLGPDQQNALFSAVVFGDLESTRFLLQRGSKVTIRRPNWHPGVRMSIFFVWCFGHHTSNFWVSVAQEFLNEPRAVARQICFNSYWMRALTSTRRIRLGHP